MTRFKNPNEKLGLPADATPEQVAAAQAAADAAAQAEKDRLAAEALAAKQTKAEEEAAAGDELYAKALNEKNGLTLIHKGKIAKNHTVKQVSDKVYPGDMVIAERL